MPLAWALVNLSNTYRFLGEIDKSLAAATESLTQFEGALGPNHFSTIHAAGVDRLRQGSAAATPMPRRSSAAASPTRRRCAGAGVALRGAVGENDDRPVGALRDEREPERVRSM